LKKILKQVGIFIIFLAIAIFVFFSIETRVTNNTDSYVYHLPYDTGVSFRVVQAYGGLFSHKNIAAIDFGMPVGTPIYASREGTVYAYKDSYTKGGPFPMYKHKANYLMIKHPDGSFGCYWHLKEKGVVVKSGFIKKGQLIGYSGKTGFVLSPHLHFSVKKFLNYKMDAFIKTKFHTSKGNIFLSKGNQYYHPEK
jgi:murein DD-endopeptidase MepM/ murein hydrolase activator NlpD